MNWKDRIDRAYARIQPHIVHTPLLPCVGVPGVPPGVFLKMETVQVTQSFKVRGAFAKLTALSPEEQQGEVWAASSGNHGAAVAYAASKLGLTAQIAVPNHADPSKVARIKRMGGAVTLAGDDCVDAERYARKQAQAAGCAYLSPYNDPEVVAGQGTIAVELHQTLPDLDAVIVAVGGGGMIGGIGAYLREVNPACQVIAASPIHSPAMHEAIRAGAIVHDVPNLPTWSDATAGGIEEGALTVPLCSEVITRSVTCSEEEIQEGCRQLLQDSYILAEGAAGLAFAAYNCLRENLVGKTVAIVLCGSAISPERIARLVKSPQK